MSDYENYVTVIVKVPPGSHEGMIYYPQEYIDDQLAALRARIAALEAVGDAVCPECGEPYSGDYGPCRVGKCQG